jgi:hypothetical protein
MLKMEVISTKARNSLRSTPADRAARGGGAARGRHRRPPPGPRPLVRRLRPRLDPAREEPGPRRKLERPRLRHRPALRSLALAVLPTDVALHLAVPARPRVAQGAPPSQGVEPPALPTCPCSPELDRWTQGRCHGRAHDTWRQRRSGPCCCCRDRSPGQRGRAKPEWLEPQR